jgi:radical SAM protein with 4Fe4S-binding SPASM domain
MPDQTMDVLVGTFPRRAYLFPTMLCNLRCSMCYSGAVNNSGGLKSEHSFDTYAHWITELHGAGVREFDISGGEPLLTPWLPELIEFIKTLEGTRVDLVTNGTLVRRHEAALGLLVGLVDTVQVSFDSAEPAEHEAIRGRRGSFSAAVAGVHALVGLGFPIVGLNMVVMRRNAGSIPQLLDLAVSVGATKVNLLRLLDVTGQGRLSGESISTPGYAAILDDVRQWLARPPSGGQLAITLVLPGYVGTAVPPRDRRADTPRGSLRTELDPLRGCFAFGNGVVITSQGAVTGCTALVQSPDWLTASEPALVPAIRRAWQQGRQRLAEREALLSSAPPCAGCPSWSVCRGGCPAAALNYFGSSDNSDPTCPYMTDPEVPDA